MLRRNFHTTSRIALYGPTVSSKRQVNDLITIAKRQNITGFVVFKRNINFLKVLRVPGYIGGTVAAGGSYVAFKVDQMNTYTMDKLGGFKDFTSDLFDKGAQFFKSSEGSQSNGGESTGSESSGDGGNGGDTAAMTATAAAVAVSSDQDEEDDLEETDDIDDNETNDQMLNLTKQMIEIRNILSTIDTNNDLKLPSIVVVGSQSSGKSSVLESIVGHEFLPKGDNMVTKRPIELTLVNSPESASEIIEFPALKMTLSDFKQAQKVLVDLNLAVPNSQFVSDDPIQITIRSPKIPDLSLVDLPGYIQIESFDQPSELKLKIKNLCDKYLQAPNIILAISAANVDLANSTALRSARFADPKGERTIGVVTKLDLVEPSVAQSILLNQKYPLKLGYIGVITKIPKLDNGNFLTRKSMNSYQSYLSQQTFETNYFKTHNMTFINCSVGTKVLKRKLIKILERSMVDNLIPTHLTLQREFEETNYKFKVEFNDVPLTPAIYLANNIDILKLSIKELSKNFGKKELKAIIKNELDQKILNLLAENYWNGDGNLSELANSILDPIWARKMDYVANSFTKLGVGRLSTGLITNILLQEVENLVDNTQLKNHPLAKQAVKDSAKLVLSNKYYSTADQVENCIKPFKYEIEIEDSEWAISKDNAINLMKQEIKNCDEVLHDLKQQIGGRKLNQVMKYLRNLKDQNQIGDIDFKSIETLGFSNSLINKGKFGIFLEERLSLLKMRYQFLKNNSKCKKKENKCHCPEIYLDVINNKLTATSILFLNVELLNDFYYNFPRDLDVKFFNDMTDEEMENFAMEDPKIKAHIDLQSRKDLLALALNRIESIMAVRNFR